MSKREEFIAFINTLKTVSPAITDEQRIGLLRQARQQYGLTVDAATEILKASGLVVGEGVNYFKALGLSIAAIQNQSETGIANLVKTAHKKRYSASLRAGGRIRPDGKTEEQWRTLLNQARDTLQNPQKRLEHIASLKDKKHSLYTESTSSILDDMALIPTGEFQMGSNDEKVYDDEKPAHTVYLEAFYIDKYPVTNNQYKTFIDANPQWHKHYIQKGYHNGNYLRHWKSNTYPNGEADYPVVNVSWYAAMAYAEWMGKRLPTEAEWERAARGGVEGKKYPWGDTIDPTKANYDWNVGEITPVGNYPENGYGLHDVCGNVWEWCFDVYDADFYMSAARQNPISGVNIVEQVINHTLNDKLARVLRGGSWRIQEAFVRVTNRNAEVPTFTLDVIGFRCAQSVTL